MLVVARVVGMVVVLVLAGACSVATDRGADRAAGPTSSSAPPSGSPTSAPAAPRRPPSPPPCVRGTRDVGVQAGYRDGRRNPVRLCAVPGLPSSDDESTPGSRFHVRGSRGWALVSSAISGPTLRLVRRAAARGVPLSVRSSFRTHRHQVALCREDPGCAGGDHTYVAPPGWSNHQAGLALDVEGTYAIGGRTCRQRATDRDSPVWRFLEREARALGFRQYAAESWHWEVSTSAGRC